jgi:hypothetical protein
MTAVKLYEISKKDEDKCMAHDQILCNCVPNTYELNIPKEHQMNQLESESNKT